MGCVILHGEVLTALGMAAGMAEASDTAEAGSAGVVAMAEAGAGGATLQAGQEAIGAQPMGVPMAPMK